MIIVKLRGALGNQLFQYAFGRAVSLKKKSPLLIDKSPLYSYEAQSYFGLDKYRIKGIVLPFRASRVTSVVDKLTKDKFKYIQWIDKDEIIDLNILKQVDDLKNVVLDGHWQSEKYFHEYKDVILKDLSLKRKLSTESDRLLWEINSSESVSLHIRRGDYVKNKDVNKRFGSLGVKHYEEAAQIILKKFKNSRFFIFSDDIEWARSNLRIKAPLTFVNGNLEYPQEDLFLMSKCKHNIIANSTFSWWGAYMNRNPNKIVIAPKQWFADPKRNKYSSDILLDSWIKI